MQNIMWILFFCTNNTWDFTNNNEVFVGGSLLELLVAFGGFLAVGFVAFSALSAEKVFAEDVVLSVSQIDTILCQS